MLRVAVLSVLVALASAVAPLKWPAQYTAKGIIILPYGDISEPFTAYVDMDKKMSRLDTYDGTAIVINRGDMGDHGTMYKIVPVTTGDYTNKKTCFKIAGSSDGPVTAQGILPDISQYKYTVDYPYNGKPASVYLSGFVENTKTNNYTLIVDKKTSNPMFLRFIGFDRLFGSHYDEYIIEYNEFNNTVNASVFDFAKTMTCGDFPGPGVKFPAVENPFFEFMGSEGYKDYHRTAKVDGDFDEFKDKHERRYDDEAEESQRKTHFRHNHRYIHSMNRKDLPFKLKINHMTDYSDEELQRMRGYRRTKDSPRGESYVATVQPEALPPSYNWRIHGAVTPVKDQGICGSCWSFGTTGTIEGSYFLKTKNLVAMSEQALVDCSWGFGNNGCDGGESERAFKWIIKNGCIPTEASYDGGLYKMEDTQCNFNQSVCGANVTKFFNTKSGDVVELLTAIYEHGPISVAIDASHRSFSFYSHGVYYEPKCGNTDEDLDHQVLAVGFGVLDNQVYFYIKNSWSTHWGNDGYILMKRDKNMCGVATDASYGEIVVP